MKKMQIKVPYDAAQKHIADYLEQWQGGCHLQTKVTHGA